MGRPPRYYPTPDTVYHVISRGNNRQQIFLDNRDYHGYLTCGASTRWKWICMFTPITREGIDRPDKEMPMPIDNRQ